MNHEKLSKRLEQVALHIPKESILADIGSDHAYLPCYAVQKGLAKQAIAGEVAEGPFLSAKKQVKLTQLEGQIEVRKGNGLEVLAPNEVTCITIAGMGGTLISSILENGKDKLPGVMRLVLQPNVGAHVVREWLIENGWALTAEEILEEDGKIYEILIAQPGEPLSAYPADKEGAIIFGPFLMQEQNDVFQKKWNLEKYHWQRIIDQMDKKGQKSETAEKRKELLEQIRQVEEMLKG